MAENKTYSPTASASSTEINYSVDTRARRIRRLPDRLDVQGLHARRLAEGRPVAERRRSTPRVRHSVEDFHRLRARAHDQHARPTSSATPSPPRAATRACSTRPPTRSTPPSCTWSSSCRSATSRKTAESMGVHLRRHGAVAAGQRRAEVPDCIASMTLGPFRIAPLTMADGLRDVRRRRHLLPTVPGPVDQGRGRERRPDQGADVPAGRARPGHRPRRHVRAQGRHHPRHGDRNVNGLMHRPRRRQDRHHRTTPSTPGSSATPRSGRRPSGSATRPRTGRKDRHPQEPQPRGPSAAALPAPSSARRSPAPIWAEIMQTAVRGTDTGRLGQPADRRCSAAAAAASGLGARRHRQVDRARRSRALAQAGFTPQRRRPRRQRRAGRSRSAPPRRAPGRRRATARP